MTKSQLVQNLIHALPTKSIMDESTILYTIIDGEYICLKNRYYVSDKVSNEEFGRWLDENVEIKISSHIQDFVISHNLAKKCRDKIVYISREAFGKKGLDAIDEHKKKDEVEIIGSFSAEGKSKFIVQTIDDKEKQIKDKIEKNKKMIRVAEGLVAKLKKQNQDMHCEIGALNKAKKVFGGEN